MNGRNDMPKFQIKAEETVTYIYEVEADTIEEAVALVEEGDADDYHEVDSTAPSAEWYAVYGQPGWIEWQKREE
jgi:hypothetical protein